MKKITFTSMVKEEICSIDFDDKELLIMLSGFCKVNGNLSLTNGGMSLTLKTENSKIAKWVYLAFKKLFNVTPSYTYSKKMNFDKSSVFNITINENVLDILEKLELMEDGMPSNPTKLVLEEGLRYFIAGSFLASGSVNSPTSKNYHLQMVVFTEEDGKYYLKLLNRFRNNRSMEFKTISRRKKVILYLKKADQIATFLSIVFSHNCLFEFENARIEKDFINSENRIQICYTANYQRSLAKGEEQCMEIQKIKEAGVFGLLTEKEQLVANIRENNPDFSLNQIGDFLLKEYNIKLSKSGVNHIFSKIHDKYKELEYDE